MSQQNANEAGGQVILVAVYDDEVHAQHAIEQLRDKGVALDMLSVLGRVHASGDDVLGIYYSGMYGEAGRRVQVIMLDSRSFRSALKPRDAAFPHWGKYLSLIHI